MPDIQVNKKFKGNYPQTFYRITTSSIKNSKNTQRH
jgi:hypothetical protein